MTRKLFWEDMYQQVFEARVETVAGNNLVLDQTAFNPRGGGLVSDTGTINGIRVVEVTREGDTISHAFASPPPLKTGDPVKGVLDWERRHRVMRMHTAAHILSSVVNRETGALITGNQINPDESRVDFNLDSFDREKMSVYIDSVNEAVKRGLEIRTYFMRREEAVTVPGLVKLAKAAPPSLEVLRIVEIGDVDTQADGGVHVRNTNEIGTVVGLRTENKGKNNRRLYFTVQ
ncbi:MAG TPA: alanyl-tRNA editing protein [Nitrososphaerales archaeon]|nr:alanyl-tRNA editing protein [Nitrososphaerales archaeon]